MNVIILVNDSLRMDHCGCYNDVLPTVKCQGRPVSTPNIDWLASQSARFTHVFPEGLPTLPVRTAVFTGRYTFPFRGWSRIEPTDVLLAEILWDKGYRTCLCTDCYHLHKPGMAYERGFDEVVFVRGNEGDPAVVDPSIKVDIMKDFFKPKERDAQFRVQAEQYLRNVHDWDGSDDCCFSAQVIKRAIKWLEEQKRKDNLFLCIDCFDPHEPWDPQGKFASMYTDPAYKGLKVRHPVPGPTEGYLSAEELQYTKACYAGKCSQTDKWDGVLFDYLKNSGMLQNTLILFYSDHGEPFGERGYVRKSAPCPYEELVRIPMIVYHPEGVGKGKSFNQLGQTCDFAPTILDFLGIDTKFFRMHGQSLLPVMSGQKEKLRDYAYVGHHGRSVRICDHEWAFHDYTWGKIRNNELFRYAEDPAMQNDLIAQHPEKARELELIMRRFVGSLGGPNWG